MVILTKATAVKQGEKAFNGGSRINSWRRSWFVVTLAVESRLLAWHIPAYSFTSDRHGVKMESPA